MIDIKKESLVEYIENIYALSVNYLKNNNNFELKGLIKELELIEDKIRLSKGTELNSYEILLKNLIDRIEGIINE